MISLHSIFYLSIKKMSYGMNALFIYLLFIVFYLLNSNPYLTHRLSLKVRFLECFLKVFYCLSKFEAFLQRALF